jgi:hypothetical protein
MRPETSESLAHEERGLTGTAAMVILAITGLLWTMILALVFWLF